jgi:regulator of sigma E protease
VKPILGEIEPDSVAAAAGLQSGMEIVEVAGRKTPTWEAVIHRSIGRILDSEVLTLRVVDDEGWERELDLSLADVDVDDVGRGNLFEKLGFSSYNPTVPAIIGDVLPDTPAEAAGLRPGDEVVAADGRTIGDWSEWVEYVRARPERLIETQVRREHDTVLLQITPQIRTENGDSFGFIGAAVKPLDDLYAVERYSPLAAVPRAITKTYEIAIMTLRVLGKMLVGDASIKNLSGPISIAQYAGQSASLGFSVFLGFLAIVSVSLGVLNLLPVPLLDGGHLLYYLIEFVSGRPVSESAQIAGQQIGLFVLLGLMGLAFYNDIMRIL